MAQGPIRRSNPEVSYAWRRISFVRLGRSYHIPTLIKIPGASGLASDERHLYNPWSPAGPHGSGNDIQIFTANADRNFDCVDLLVRLGTVGAGVSGKVSDPAGASVPGASVTVKSTE